ncbi:MAG: type II secretion system F family protein [Oscillospiraceae bacterium]|nr:type II secretion system F family protein [Oscillospiraceae bacterium]
MAIKMLTNEETAFFCEQLAMILEAGVSIADGIEVLAEDAGDKRFKEIADTLVSLMKDDMTIFDAMDNSGLFPEYAVKMVKIGSLTGRLEDALKGLADYYAKRAELRQTIKSSVAHPLMLLAMMTVVIVVMVIKIIPMFRDIFFQFDDSAAAAVEGSITFAYNIGLGVMITLAAVLVITLVIVLLMKIPSARKGLKGFAANFILTKNLSETMAMADVTNAISMMASCGISPEQSLEMVQGLTVNKTVQKRIKECEKLVLDGEYFADAIAKSKLLPSIYAHSLKVAYKSGSFDSAWQKLAERFNQECDRKIYGAVSFIEPVIIGILAIIIGSVLLAVMLPMTDIITTIG